MGHNLDLDDCEPPQVARLTASITKHSSRLVHLSVTLIGHSYTVSSLVDCGATLNFVHEAFVSSLNISTVSCPTTKVVLADGHTLAHSNKVVTLQVNICGVIMTQDFLVAPIGIHSVILGMPWLETVNPDINWILKTVKLRSDSPSESAFSTSSTSSTSNAFSAPSASTRSDSTRSDSTRSDLADLADPAMGIPTRSDLPDLADPAMGTPTRSDTTDTPTGTTDTPTGTTATGTPPELPQNDSSIELSFSCKQRRRKRKSKRKELKRQRRLQSSSPQDPESRAE